MALINWNEDTMVNFEEIDSQHKVMVDIVNELHDSISIITRERVIETLHVLLDDLKHHFKTEEDYMTKYKYHGYISHKLEHDRVIKNLTDYILKLESKEKELTPEFLKSFRNWFLNHLELNDKKCGKFIKEKVEECA